MEGSAPALTIVACVGVLSPGGERAPLLASGFAESQQQNSPRGHCPAGSSGIFGTAGYTVGFKRPPERSSGGLQMETKSLDMEDPASGSHNVVQFEERRLCQSDCSGQIVAQIIGSVADGGCRDAGFVEISR